MDERRNAGGASCSIGSRGVPYAVGVKQIDCVCGVVVKGEDDDELWQRAQEHLRSDHPELVDKVSRADIIAQAEET
jgi:predicted small metal-binding protein